MNFTLGEKKVMWVVGALERLATLGYFSKILYKIPSNNIDTFLEIDEERFSLFDSQEDFVSVIIGVIGKDFDIETIETICKLVWDYKEQRTKLVSKGLVSLM